MSERPTPQRVRVTGPPRRRPPMARKGEVDADTRLGGVYVGSLLREQLWLAVRTLALLVVTIGSLPVVFHVAPGLASVRVGPVPVAWLVLGVASYPLLVVLAWRYIRSAERNEAAFAELMDEVER
ncbi:MAG: hypothetical protein KKE65_00995 [Actinobacteria bacterium]|uniref:Uncharacterized protein n=1 Tax=Nocardioides marinus TaxID=374514 RepID=A0A7Y9YAC9_9ACTN|nr:hypothetical protein [Actinomycetota bacterium]MBU2110212.1 hypothetical protein [Actinomycetota bacterium]NYI08526.1 hypothetical protein [Nocardioides marinus]